ncbi:hypothetical protein BC567DRAFT_42552 [Phyllosticta citribraziliensis]
MGPIGATLLQNFVCRLAMPSLNCLSTLPHENGLNDRARRVFVARPIQTRHIRLSIALLLNLCRRNRLLLPSRLSYSILSNHSKPTKQMTGTWGFRNSAAATRGDRHLHQKVATLQIRRRLRSRDGSDFQVNLRVPVQKAAGRLVLQLHQQFRRHFWLVRRTRMYILDQRQTVTQACPQPGVGYRNGVNASAAYRFRSTANIFSYFTPFAILMLSALSLPYYCFVETASAIQKTDIFPKPRLKSSENCAECVI